MSESDYEVKNVEPVPPESLRRLRLSLPSSQGTIANFFSFRGYRSQFGWEAWARAVSKIGYILVLTVYRCGRIGSASLRSFSSAQCQQSLWPLCSAAARLLYQPAETLTHAACAFRERPLQKRP